ncbi:hypothetical protein JW960_11165 [candidate division KSB1 bacterium]|nr:hypothetical protein [candidate division KSB1 bacterium]
MYKYIIISMILSLPVALCAATTNSKTAKPDSSNGLSDIVVEAAYQGPTEEEKFPFILHPDYSDVVQIPERIDWSSIQADPQMNQAVLKEPPRLQLPATNLAAIQAGTVKEFQVNFKNIRNWDFKILSGTGAVFCTMTGEGDPPSTIVWDGRSNDGKLLEPGQQYSFSFTPVDKAGNKRTFPGEPFSIPAICMIDSQGVHIGISHDQLFSVHGFGMLPASQKIIAETASLVRYYYHTGKAKIESAHPQRDDFLKQLEDELKVTESFFSVHNIGKQCVWIHLIY